MTSKGICWFLLDDMKIIGKKRKKESDFDEQSSDPYECLSAHNHFTYFFANFLIPFFHDIFTL